MMVRMDMQCFSQMRMKPLNCQVADRLKCDIEHVENLSGSRKDSSQSEALMNLANGEDSALVEHGWKWDIHVGDPAVRSWWEINCYCKSRGGLSIWISHWECLNFQTQTPSCFFSARWVITWSHSCITRSGDRYKPRERLEWPTI